jgi:hypothetical protein
VRREPVPDEVDLVAVEVVVKLDEELRDRFVVVRTRHHAEPQGSVAGLSSIPRSPLFDDWVPYTPMPYFDSPNRPQA